MTKDVAVVHWQEGSVEKQARAYTLQMLSQLIQTMEKKGVVYWVCLTQLDTIIPVRTQKPITATLTTREYDSKADVSKQSQKPFSEVTRIEQIHHPPTMLENKAHAEKVRKLYRDVQGY